MDKTECRLLVNRTLDWFEKNPERWISGSFTAQRGPDGEMRAVPMRDADLETCSFCFVGRLAIEVDPDLVTSGGLDLRAGFALQDARVVARDCADAVLGDASLTVTRINDTSLDAAEMTARIRALLPPEEKS